MLCSSYLCLHSHPHTISPPHSTTLFSIKKSPSFCARPRHYFLHIEGRRKWPARAIHGSILVELNTEARGKDEEENDSTMAKSSGTSARGRRLLRVREEKRKREYDRMHNYPTWAKILENACKDDEELRSVLGDSVGNPELMRKRVEERVRKKGKDFLKSKTGSVLSFKVIQSWYVMGRLGAFNSLNLQLANSSMDHNPLYDADVAARIMPSSFHDISNVEFQDNWGRVWVDLGTTDYFAVDVLLNCLTVLSSEYLGIQQVVFGGRRMGDWEEGMTSKEDGYKFFKI